MKISCFEELKSTTKRSARLPGEKPESCCSLSLSRWFIWRPYCFIIHSCTASPTSGPYSASYSTHSSLINETILVLIVRCYYQQLVCLLPAVGQLWTELVTLMQIKGCESEGMSWNSCISELGKSGDKHRQITWVEEGTDADCRKKDVTLCVSLPQHLYPCVCYVPCWILMLPPL